MDDHEKGLYAIAIFRIMVGWLLLWGFIDKMFGLGFRTPAGQGVIDGGSPSSFIAYADGGILADLYNTLAGNVVADVLLMAGLLILGTTLIIGIASKLTTILTVAFLVVMYTLWTPPPDNPLIDDHIVMSMGMVATYYLGGFEKLSLNGWWRSIPIVERFPILG